MKRPTKALLLIGPTLAFQSIRFAEAVEVCKQDVAIFLTNGIANTRAAAEENREDLTALMLDLQARRPDFNFFENKAHLLYNETEGFFNDNRQLLINKRLEAYEFEGRYGLVGAGFGVGATADIGMATAIRDRFKMDVRLVDTVSQKYDFRNQYPEIPGVFFPAITKNIDFGTKAVLVAHSQGNMYANKLYEIISAQGPEPSLDRPFYRNHFGIVGVASVAAINYGPYVTSANDGAVVAEGSGSICRVEQKASYQGVVETLLPMSALKTHAAIAECIPDSVDNTVLQVFGVAAIKWPTTRATAVAQVVALPTTVTLIEWAANRVGIALGEEVALVALPAVLGAVNAAKGACSLAGIGKKISKGFYEKDKAFVSTFHDPASANVVINSCTLAQQDHPANLNHPTHIEVDGTGHGFPLYLFRKETKAIIENSIEAVIDELLVPQRQDGVQGCKQALKMSTVRTDASGNQTAPELLKTLPGFVVRPEKTVEYQAIDVKSGQTFILDASQSTVIGHPIRAGDQCTPYGVPDHIWPSRPKSSAGANVRSGPKSVPEFVWKQLAGESVTLSDASKPISPSIQQNCDLRNQYLTGPNRLRWPLKYEAVTFVAPKTPQVLKFEVALARMPNANEPKRDKADSIAYPQLTQKAIIVVNVTPSDPKPEEQKPIATNQAVQSAMPPMQPRRCRQADTYWTGGRGGWACTMADYLKEKIPELGRGGWVLDSCSGPTESSRCRFTASVSGRLAERFETLSNRKYSPPENRRSYVVSQGRLGTDLKNGLASSGVQLLHDVVGVGQATAIYVGEAARGPYRAAVYGSSLRAGPRVAGNLGFVGTEPGVSEIQIHDRVGKLVDVRRVTTVAQAVPPPPLKLMGSGEGDGIVVNAGDSEPFKVALFGKSNAPFNLKVVDGPLQMVDQPWPDQFTLRPTGAGIATVNIEDNDFKTIATEKIVILPKSSYDVDTSLKRFKLETLPAGSSDPDHHGGFPIVMYLPPPQNSLLKVDKNILVLGEGATFKVDPKLGTNPTNQTREFGSLSLVGGEYRLTASTQLSGSPIGWITTSGKPVRVEFPVIGDIMVSTTPRLGFYRLPPGVAIFRSTATANSGFHGTDVVSVIGHEGPYSLHSSNPRIVVDPYTNGFNFYLLTTPGWEKERTTISVLNKSGAAIGDVIMGQGVPQIPMYVGNPVGASGKGN